MFEFSMLSLLSRCMCVGGRVFDVSMTECVAETYTLNS